MWSYSLVAEVYTLNALFTAILVFCLVSWINTRKELFFYLAAFSYAISFGNHLTMIGLLPAFGYAVWVVDRKIFINPKKIGIIVIFVLIGFSQYGYIIWRTNDPTTAFLEMNTKDLLHLLTHYKSSASFIFSPYQLITERIPLALGYVWKEFRVWNTPGWLGNFQLKKQASKYLLGIVPAWEHPFFDQPGWKRDLGILSPGIL